MAEYISPDERNNALKGITDKFIESYSLFSEVFEPRMGKNFFNITVRTSSINSNLESQKGKVNTSIINDYKDKVEPESGTQTNQKDPPIHPKLLAILTSLEEKATLKRIDLSQTQTQK